MHVVKHMLHKVAAQYEALAAACWVLQVIRSVSQRSLGTRCSQVRLMSGAVMGSAGVAAVDNTHAIKEGGNSGPDSWQFWAPNRQLLAAQQQESAQTANGGSSGPDSWQFWGPNRQLLAAQQQESAQATTGGSSGPDSWQFWGPNRQLLAKESAQVGYAWLCICHCPRP